MAKAKTSKPRARSARNPAAARRAPSAQKWSAEQTQAYDSIRKRADELGRNGGAQFDKDGKPTGAWAEMLVALDAWAKKHKVKQTTREHEHVARKKEADVGMPTPGWQPCLPSTDHRGPYNDRYTHCTLKRTRQRLNGSWKCVYTCEVIWGEMPAK